jgi:hypothetical protein
MRYGPLWQIWLCAMGTAQNEAHTVKNYNNFCTIGHGEGFGYALWAIAKGFSYQQWPMEKDFVRHSWAIALNQILHHFFELWTIAQNHTAAFKSLPYLLKRQ